VRFQREVITRKLFDEMYPMFERNFKEIETFQDMGLDFDYERYEAIEKNGSYRLFTARNGSGGLIGYAAYFVDRHIRHNKTIQASQDVIYIVPESRGIGGLLLRFCENELKKEGVSVIYSYVKIAHSKVFSPLCEKLGYQLTDYVYSKKLNGGV